MGSIGEGKGKLSRESFPFPYPNPTPSSSKIFVRVNGVAGGLYGWPLAFVSR